MKEKTIHLCLTVKYSHICRFQIRVSQVYEYVAELIIRYKEYCYEVHWLYHNKVYVSELHCTNSMASLGNGMQDKSSNFYLKQTNDGSKMQSENIKFAFPQRCKDRSSCASSVLRVTIQSGDVLCCWESSFLALFTVGKEFNTDWMSLLALFPEDKELNAKLTWKLCRHCSNWGWLLDRCTLCNSKLLENLRLEANIAWTGCCPTTGYRR